MKKFKRKFGKLLMANIQLIVNKFQQTEIVKDEERSGSLIISADTKGNVT